MADLRTSIMLFDPGLLCVDTEASTSDATQDHNKTTPSPYHHHETDGNTEGVCEKVDQDLEQENRKNEEKEVLNDDSESEEDDVGWAGIPSVLLERIYRSMTYCERLRVSSVSKHWRSLLYTPSLWRDVDLYVDTLREGKKAYFLTKCIQFAKNVRIHWPVMPKTTINQNRHRPMDLHNRETLKSLFTAMKKCENLRTLILKLENPCAFSPDFSQHTQNCLRHICKYNKNLTQLSFGCNSTIIPAITLDLLSNKSKLRELHIGRYKPPYSKSHLDAGPVLSVNDLASFSELSGLENLTIDWYNVSPGVIQGLTKASSKLKKINILMSSHNCTPSAHPIESDWEQFAEKHDAVKISLSFVQHFRGACSSIAIIKPAVYLIKVLECTYVDPDEFGHFLQLHKNSLKALVFNGTWDGIELETGPALWPAVAACFGLKHLTFLGHYILDEILIFIASHFALDSFVVSKPHIMMFAEASPYLLPTSASKYNQFRQEISAILQHPWEATSAVQLQGFYFAEGKDDSVYIPDD